MCTSEDLTCEDVWRGVARRLGEWHARLPILGENPKALAEISELDESLLMSPSKLSIPLKAINAITPGKSTPNLWTVLQKWIFTLPTTTDAEKKRKSVLQKELERTVAELGNTPGLGRDGVGPPYSPAVKFSVPGTDQQSPFNSSSSDTATF